MALSPINPGRRIDQNQHLNHEHPMTEMQRKNDGHIFYCDGCGDPVLGPSYYTCNICYEQRRDSFDLHKSCAELPGEIHHPIHRKHPLTLDKSDRKKSCSACHQDCTSSFSYSCFQCEFNIDLQCASNWRNILDFHDHKFTILRKPAQLPCEACGKDSTSIYNRYSAALYLCSICQLLVHLSCSWLPSHVKTGNTYKCRGCGTSEKKFWFNCRRCDFHLCISCVKLPLTARHRYDNHPLKLTYDSVKNELDEYYCEISEGKRDPKLWFYSCSDCDFDCHPHCILGRYPQVKLGDSYKHPAHPHLVTLVEKRRSKIPSDKRKRILPCDKCSKPCEGLVFECSECNINFHVKCGNF